MHDSQLEFPNKYLERFEDFSSFEHHVLYILSTTIDVAKVKESLHVQLLETQLEQSILKWGNLAFHTVLKCLENLPQGLWHLLSDNTLFITEEIMKEWNKEERIQSFRQ